MPTAQQLSPISAAEEESSVESIGPTDRKQRLDRGGTALCMARGSTSVRVPDDSSGGQTPATTAQTAVGAFAQAAGLDSEQLLLLHVVQSEWAEEDKQRKALESASGSKTPKKGASPRSPAPSIAKSTKSSRSPMRSCASTAGAQEAEVTFAGSPTPGDWEMQLRRSAELEKRLQLAEAQLLESRSTQSSKT